MKISVIIPTYNRVEKLENAINSVLEQSYQNFEIIIINDASSDSTKNFLSSLNNEKIITINQKKNMGVAAARNKGILASQGELIAFLDDDDLWLPSKLAVQANFFKKNKSAQIAQSQEIWIRNGKRINPQKKHKKESGIFFDRSLEICLVSPSAVIMRRSFFDKVGLFDEKLKACEDYDLWLRCFAASIWVYLIDEELIIKQGGHNSQLSAQPCLDKYRIESLKKLILSKTLTKENQIKTIKILQKKCKILIAGLKKRNKYVEAKYYETIHDDFCKDLIIEAFEQCHFWSIFGC